MQPRPTDTRPVTLNPWGLVITCFLNMTAFSTYLFTALAEGDQTPPKNFELLQKTMQTISAFSMISALLIFVALLGKAQAKLCRQTAGNHKLFQAKIIANMTGVYAITNYGSTLPWASLIAQLLAASYVDGFENPAYTLLTTSFLGVISLLSCVGLVFLTTHFLDKQIERLYACLPGAGRPLLPIKTSDPAVGPGDAEGDADGNDGSHARPLQQLV